MNSLNEKIIKLTTKEIESIIKNKGYAFFTNGSYNLNIIGVRRMKSIVSNNFDDALIVICKDEHNSYFTRYQFDITTDPGLKSMKNPIANKGCAILVPGQYRGGWRIGFHQGKYQALVQNKPVKVYRDNNKDNIYNLDPKTIEEGMFGINIHKAGVASTLVDGWSAGCQVFANKIDYDSFMTLCYKQIEYGFGKTFTYTLLTEEELLNYNHV